MKKTILSVLIASAAVLISCKKESVVEQPTPNNNVTDFEDLVIPSNFLFETGKTIDLNINVTAPGFANKTLIKVYDDFPTSSDANLIYSGFTSNKQLNAKLRVSGLLKRLFIVNQNSDGSSTLATVNVVGNTATYVFAKRKNRSKTTVVSPNCSAGCSVSYNNHSGNLNINGNDPGGVYCFTGTFNGQINVNRPGVTIRICGNATVSNLNLNSGSGLEVTDGASLSVNNLNLNQSSGEIVIFNATVTVNNNFSPNGKVTNHGILNATKSMNINGQAEFINNGTLTVTNHFNNNHKLTNNNTINVAQDLSLNGGSTNINNCLIIVGEKLNVNNPLSNYGLIDVADKFTVNGGGATTLYDGAMINASEATINSSITGSGTTSLVKIGGNTTINGGGSLNGNLEYCDADGIESNTGSINAPATLACNVYIPTSACNNLGNGTPAITDTDNDGVADENDLFPNDPARSGESFYPGSGQYGTLAFEDLWPGRGDYDFNDLVVDYNYRFITNANNEVKDVELKYSIRAIGGSLNNGFGVQLNVPQSAVQSVTGSQIFGSIINFNANGTEAGQSNAVIIVFDQAFGVMPNTGTIGVNTTPSEPGYALDTALIKVVFSSAQTVAQLGDAPFNPFIFVGQDRGKEVHLAGKEPTDLVNTSYFGTASDDSDPAQSRYYVTDKNLPWAMDLAQSFAYPIEKVDIINAYNYFASWAQSGGSNSLDWYVDLPGYRSGSSIY